MQLTVANLGISPPGVGERLDAAYGNVIVSQGFSLLKKTLGNPLVIWHVRLTLNDHVNNI